MEDTIFIGAVDPGNADRVYLRSSGLMTGGQSRLTVVNGASTRDPDVHDGVDVFDVGMAKPGEITGELLGLALSPDGSKVYVGTKEDGLLDGCDHATSSSRRSPPWSCSAWRRAATSSGRAPPR